VVPKGAICWGERILDAMEIDDGSRGRTTKKETTYKKASTPFPADNKVERRKLEKKRRFATGIRLISKNGKEKKEESDCMVNKAVGSKPGKAFFFQNQKEERGG